MSFGTIFEEPESYGDTSPTRHRSSTLHRMRRATSMVSLDRMLSMDRSNSSPSSPWNEYRQKSYSTMSIPAQRRDYIRRFSTLSDQFPIIIGNSASPVHEDAGFDQKSAEAGQDLDEDEYEGDICCVAVTPSHLMDKKYRRRYFLPKSYDENVPHIKGLKTTFTSLGPTTSQTAIGELKWMPCESPEGSIYFREASHNIVTFVDLYNDNYRDGVSECALHLLHKIRNQQEPMPEDTEIAIMLEDYDEDGYGYGYYLTSWEKRCVFWLDDVDYEFVTRDARVCITESHIGKHVEYLFWYVRECQHSLIYPDDVIDEMKNVLNLGVFDHITSNNSIFPYDRVEASEILRCLDRVKPSQKSASDMWIVARCKQNLTEYKFLNYHGERGARIHRDDSVLKNTIRRERSLLFKLVTPFLFFMPSVYMKEIESVWIDETVDWISWRKFITLLLRDWNQSITPATVILSANVGFLAIQSIDTDSPNRSATQIVSYISSVLSFFNFITVQILSHQHRYSESFSATKACNFLERRSQQFLGLESVALTFSLPTALFIWSMLTFLTSLMIVFFWRTSLATRISLGTMLTILISITVLLLWLDWNSHSSSPEPYEAPDLERSILCSICPPGLRPFLFGVKERWQAQGFFKLIRRRKRSSAVSVASTHSESDTSTVYEKDAKTL
ncbi:hypothetical protein BDY19DRAFT_992535 [Irpex rosettiformis]|uniref:Uncharacterized protein n=1 Tax=Irpex rosettiformis TaxID=378272 RepID=A0ACB8U7X0_9APHY|nr:hypothetical protein BDY19DRAFT_992535 [Irpex rosettiformis]